MVQDANEKFVLTLRDQFAMAALTGMLASGVDSPNFRTDQAEYCFAVADAMLEARKPRGEPIGLQGVDLWSVTISGFGDSR